MAIPIIRSDQDILSSVQTYQKPDWILYISLLTLGLQNISQIYFVFKIFPKSVKLPNRLWVVEMILEV